MLHLYRLLITFSQRLDTDQAWQNVMPDLDPNFLPLWWYYWKNFSKKLILKNIGRRQKSHAKLPRMQSHKISHLIVNTPSSATICSTPNLYALRSTVNCNFSIPTFSLYLHESMLMKPWMFLRSVSAGKQHSTAVQPLITQEVPLGKGSTSISLPHSAKWNETWNEPCYVISKNVAHWHV